VFTDTTPLVDRLRLVDRVASLERHVRAGRQNFWAQHAPPLNDVWSSLVLATTTTNIAPNDALNVMSIKVIVHVSTNHRRAASDRQAEKCQFTCSAGTCAQLVMMQALDEETVRVSGTVLKVYGTDEYLHPDMTLAQLVYVRECIRFDRDVRFEIADMPHVVGVVVVAIYFP
jgi:hypothetical protein